MRTAPMVRPRGFTLMELLIVTTIICILASILFPVFARAREKAYTTNCMSNLRELGVALRLYSFEACSHFPPKDDDLRALAPYLPDREVMACPTVLRQLPDDLDKAIAKSYRFKGGVATDDLPNLVIACERDRAIHSGGASYLFLDGHVKWLGEHAWEDPVRTMPELGKPWEGVRR